MRMKVAGWKKEGTCECRMILIGIKKRGHRHLMKVLIIFLALSSFVLLSILPVQAINDEISYVNKDDDSCGGSAPCYTSIQSAINVAQSGSVIRVSKGSYNENPAASNKTFTIQGGWNSSFSSQTANSTFIKSPSVFNGSLKFQMISFVPYYIGALDIIIDYGLYNGENKKDGVTFSHGSHISKYEKYAYPEWPIGIDCIDCHHKYLEEYGENVWKPGDAVQKCIECHHPDKYTTIDGMQVVNLQNAFHGQCKTCHKICERFGLPSGPFLVCAECHNVK